MALFNFTRYTDEDLNDDDPSAVNEKLILKNLNEKSSKKGQIQTSHRITAGVKVSASKKRKIAKISNNNDYNIVKDAIPNNKASTDKPSKKKRKITEKAEKVNISEHESDEETLTEVSGAKPSKKKRKQLENTEKIDISKDESVPTAVEVSGGAVDEADERQDVEEAFTVIGQQLAKKTTKVQHVLPNWLAQPSIFKSDICNNTTELSHVTNLSSSLLKRLRSNGIQSYFPVQAQVMPALLSDTSSGFLTGRAGYRPCDMCCSAPTGSGKTLSYVLPIVQALKERVACQVRALVVLPVQDLALQVYKVFQSYCKGTKLKVGCVTGSVSLDQEQTLLLRKLPRGFQSNIDILIATPGRLVDHINHTEGFSLQELRFLVIDEADRMMEEVKQDWLAQVERAVYVNGRTKPGPLTAASMAQTHTPVQKLLFSATLSQNPEKLQQLELFQPKLFTSAVEKYEKEQNDMDISTADSSQMSPSHKKIAKQEFIGKYTTPEGLSEYYYETETSEKQLALLYFLKKLEYKQVLCFTNSVETTHRLYWLIKLVGGIEVEEFSSRQNSNKRTDVLRKFEKGKIDILICSDAMSRGMDVGNVKYVISYESPPYIKTYIHRIGRTARAGKEGMAITLLENKEIYHFKKMMTEAGKNSVKEIKVKPYAFKPYIKPLKRALIEMADKLMEEKQHRKK